MIFYHFVGIFTTHILILQGNMTLNWIAKCIAVFSSIVMSENELVHESLQLW